MLEAATEILFARKDLAQNVKLWIKFGIKVCEQRGCKELEAHRNNNKSTTGTSLQGKLGEVSHVLALLDCQYLNCLHFSCDFRK